MADKRKKKSPYTVDRNMPGAYEGETVTRRGLFTGGALAAGGIASAAFALPALGFALGPVLEDQEPRRWQDVGPEADFKDPQTDQFLENYVAKVITTIGEIGEAGKTTIYVRGEEKAPGDVEYIAISTRCAHAGCPVRYVQASQRFICPCHGGVYDAEGKVTGGPPVRPLDRFETRINRGRVEIGDRYSLDSKLKRHSPRDPGNHLDGLWQYLYPPRPTT